ncbi:MAG TPA: maleylpyruvate isomerase family mycothiol-dependent enzyme [Acidimicrobiales bacterium]|nr:maleylpyruvate isomerase family mycothiol-dependent enzyme [Acidimicrobiales bacterium]
MSATPGITADSSRDGLVAQLHEVWDALADLGASLDDHEWAAPTPCPGWPVSAQYAHVIGTESMLLSRPNPEVEEPAQPPAHVRNQIGGFNEVWVASMAARSRQEVLDAFAEVVAARKEALAAMTEEDFSAPSWTPVGQADYRRFMQIRVFDCWVHEQDVRDAVGRPGHETGPVVEQSIDEIVRAAGFVIGKKAGAPAGSGVRIELTGPASRRIDIEVADRARVVEALAAEPTATLELSSTAYTRLACGRISPAEVAGGGLGGARLRGDEALARRVLENLAFTI